MKSSQLGWALALTVVTALYPMEGQAEQLRRFRAMQQMNLFEAMAATMKRANQPAPVTRFRLDKVRDFDRRVYNLWRSTESTPPKAPTGYASPLGDLDSLVGKAPPPPSRPARLATKVSSFFGQDQPKASLPSKRIRQEFSPEQAQAATAAYKEAVAYASVMAPSLGPQQRAELNSQLINRAAAHLAAQGIAFVLQRNADQSLSLALDPRSTEHPYGRFLQRVATKRAKKGQRLAYVFAPAMLAPAANAIYIPSAHEITLGNETIANLRRSDISQLHEVMHTAVGEYDGKRNKAPTPFDMLAQVHDFKKSKDLPSFYKLANGGIGLDNKFSAYTKGIAADELRTYSWELRVMLRRLRRALKQDPNTKLPQALITRTSNLLDVGLRNEAIAKEALATAQSKPRSVTYSLDETPSARINVGKGKKGYWVATALPLDSARLTESQRSRALEDQLRWTEDTARLHADQAIVLFKGIHLLDAAKETPLKQRIVEAMIAVLDGRHRKIATDSAAKAPTFEQLVQEFNSKLPE